MQGWLAEQGGLRSHTLAAACPFACPDTCPAALGVGKACWLLVMQGWPACISSTCMLVCCGQAHPPKLPTPPFLAAAGLRGRG